MIPTESYPLSFAQQRLWFMEQWKPGSAMYTIPLIIELEGELDVEALARALNEVVRRHEILRTSFVLRGDDPVQVIAPALTIDLPRLDLTDRDPAEREAETRRAMTEIAREPFDITQPPLLRALLARLAPQSHLLLVSLHHIIFDGWSAGVFREELGQIYGAFAAGEPSPLPDLTIQYADFTLWQKEYLRGEKLQEHLAYWKERFTPLPSALNLPTDRPHPAVQSHQGATVSREIPQDLLAKVKALGQRERASLSMVVTAALATLLYRYTTQTDVVIGMPIANRTNAEIESLIGFFVNTLALRCDLSGNPTFVELLRRVRRTSLEAYEHQDLPFEKLVETLGGARDASRNPLFQVMLSVQNAPSTEVQLPNLCFRWAQDVPTATAKFDITMILEGTDEGSCLTLEYNTDVFEAETMDRLLDHFFTLLGGIVAGPERPLADLPLLTEAERAALLGAWSRSDAESAGAENADRRVHELFETQVAQAGSQVAAVYKDERLTYQELDTESQRLAKLIERLQK